MKYYIIAGEPSGDLHGSNLMRGILDADPTAEFRFCGGDKMAEVGGSSNLLMHYRDMSFFGIWQVLKNLRTIFSQIDQCKADIVQFSPDVIILIDYPSFNMRIAKWAFKRNIKVYYYIAPKVWAWKEWRVKSIRRYVSRLYAIFPFEVEYFRSKGIDAHYFGNPLTDSIAAKTDNMPDAATFREKHNLDNRPIVALLAGSRRSEISLNLPNMVALSRLFPAYQFVVTGVNWIDRSLYDSIIADSDVKYLCDATYETLSVSTAAIVTSGTATLETAMFGIPEMVVYRTAWLYEKLKPYVLKIPYISLVNINLNYECVREIVTAKFDIEAAANELQAILPNGTRREKMIEQFDHLRQMMGEKGTSRRVGNDIVKSLKQ